MSVGFEALIRAMERPCRIEATLYTRPGDEGSNWRRSYLKSERLPLHHVEYCFGGDFEKRTVSAERAADYDSCLHWPNGFPDGARQLTDLLKEVLVLPTVDDRIYLAMALDWYKILDANIPSTEWQNTEAGQLVNKAKYWTSSPFTQRAAAGTLIDMLVDAVGRHPAYRAAPHVVSVPGSKGDGSSVGEFIAAGVAQKTGKVLIRTIGPAREPRKAGGATAGLDSQFSLPSSLDGACIVVDDVYRSGMTIRATALAARRAGAGAVYGLVAAKTISG